ncbi:MAG: FecR domain-containing protein [Bacteroidetes bacterium]|nr:FecR domain-containing protein [Bacteroidota bacterium]
MNNKETYKEKIEKYLVNEASVEEIQELKALIDADEEIKDYYLRMKAIVELAESKEGLENIDIDKRYAEFLKDRKNDEDDASIPVIPMWSNIIKVAAVLLIGAGIWYVSGMKNDQPAVVVDASDEMVNKDLADGSKIVLNKHSTLSYPEKFDKNIRLVRIEGEAYFEVESNPDKPFIIEVGNARVQVMGTKFNINAYNLDSVVVTVVEGSVMVYTKDEDVSNYSEADYITEGFKGSVIKGNSTSKKEINDNLNFLFWYDGNLIFQDERLEVVVNKLNKEWNSNLVIGDELLNDCPFTTTFTQSDIDHISQVISLALELNVEPTAEGHIITGEGCGK